MWYDSQEPYDEDSDPFFMFMNIDLYAKTVSKGMYDEKCHGGFFVDHDLYEQGGDIVSARCEGNKAYIEYIDPSGLTYAATLTYNPKTRQLKFEDGDIVKQGGKDEEEILANRFYYQYHKNIPSVRLLDALLPHPHSARKGLGIYGNASKVTKDNGDVFEFDMLGNILRVEYGHGYTKEYDYVVPYKKYQINDWSNPYKIIYSNHKRSDLSEDKTDTEGSVEYFFDDQDRIVKRVEQIRMVFEPTIYTYTGKNKLPDSEKSLTYDEYSDFTILNTFEYLEVDEQGNWLKRRVTRTTEFNEYAMVEGETDSTEIHTDPPIIETRTIEYFK